MGGGRRPVAGSFDHCFVVDHGELVVWLVAAGKGDSCLSGGAAVWTPIRTKSEVDRFLEWMNAEDLAPSTQSTILSTIRSVQPGNQALRLVQVKVPPRSVQEVVLI